MSVYFHGGHPGLNPGDILVPAPPHVEDGCPICLARREGRSFTVREFRAWALTMGARGAGLLEALAGAPADATVDPPTARRAVYLTTHMAYATWYAARSRGDLYRVEPVGELQPSAEDPFPSWTVPAARVLAVLRRSVALDRRQRRELLRAWKAADRRRARARQEARS